MQQEAKYAFRKRLDEVHKAGRRDFSVVKKDNEVEINSGWTINTGVKPEARILFAAQDLQDYFLKSMDLMIPLSQDTQKKAIVLVLEEDASKKRAFHFNVEEDNVVITGTDSEGIAQGCIYLEDLMNFREAPFLCKQNEFIEPLFSPRMVHSGWGLDQYPDSHLNAIAHAGFDSILLFVKGPFETTFGYMDFNDLIDRADKFGLGVYFYSYLPSYKSPYDKDADEFFESIYGEVFRQSPKAKGLILVGESCNFPTRDPNASPSMPGERAIGDSRPHSGWWPCFDYPDWVNAVKKAVHCHAPHADIVLWTYNWGRQPKAPRIELINNLSEDTSLLATFEMYEVLDNKYLNHQAVQPDYSITFPGPGKYFSSEAEAAKRNGLKLYSMTNTAGRTWDCGIIPFEPAVQQWFKRFKAMKNAHEKWGLSGVMESHHYGWFPSPVCECAKWYFRSSVVEPEEILLKLVIRDFGEAAAEDVIQAWQYWSDAMNSYTPGFDDQNGPLRLGPAYPFIFHPILYPHDEHSVSIPVPQAAHEKHCRELYQPEHLYHMTACGRRIHEDIHIMAEALKIWEKGDSLILEALKKVPEHKRENASRMAGVGLFFGHALQTTVHIKRWWLLNKKLEIEYDFNKSKCYLDEMAEILRAELKNAEETIPIVEADSSIGWEASMDYVCDTEHIHWKICQTTNVLEKTLPEYRKTLSKNP